MIFADSKSSDLTSVHEFSVLKPGRVIIVGGHIQPENYSIDIL